jgi:hypothetical protein
VDVVADPHPRTGSRRECVARQQDQWFGLVRSNTLLGAHPSNGRPLRRRPPSGTSAGSGPGSARVRRTRTQAGTSRGCIAWPLHWRLVPRLALVTGLIRVRKSAASSAYDRLISCRTSRSLRPRRECTGCPVPATPAVLKDAIAHANAWASCLR